MSYSESELYFSNPSSPFASIFSESESDDSESHFNLVFINLGICAFLFYIYTFLNKLANGFFYLLSKQNQ